MRRTSWSSATHAALLPALLWSGCATSTPTAPERSAQAEQAERPPQTAPPAPPAMTLDESTPAGQQTRWVLDALNARRGELSEQELASRFDPSFLAQVPLPQLSQIFKQLAAAHGPLTPGSLVGATPTQLALRVTTRGGEALVVSVAVQAQAPHQILGLLFEPDPEAAAAAPLPKDWTEIEDTLKGLATQATLYVARVDPVSGQCSPVRALRGDAPQALGSTFKLYILAELSEQVSQAKLTWDSPIIIQQAYKSLPSGVLQDQPAGTSIPAREVAAKMISISDNTATDHLLAKLGRERVEARVQATGHASPARMRPFLSTREMFKMKLGRDAAWRDAYAAMSEPERRAALVELAKHPLQLPSLESAQGWDKARHIDSIEWFASGQDLCRLHAWMLKRRDDEAFKPAFQIMALNDAGLKLPSAQWRYVGYKGGSEPGVLHMSFLLERADGAWFSVTVGGNDQERAQPPMPYLTLVRGVVALLQTP